MPIDARDIKTLGETGKLPLFGQIQHDVEEIVMAVNNETEEHLKEQIKFLCECHCADIESNLQKKQEEIETEVKKIDAQLNRESDVGAMFHDKFNLPEFPASLKKPQVDQSLIESSLSGDFLKNLAQSNTKIYSFYEYKDKERKSEGFWEAIGSLFGKKYYNRVKVEKKETRYEVDRFKEELKKEIVANISNSVNKANEIMRQDQEAKITETFRMANSQCEEFKNDYLKIFDEFTDSLNLVLEDTKEHSEALENDMKILTEFKEKIQPLFGIWNVVLNGAKESG